MHFNITKFLGSGIAALGFIFAMVLLAGCESGPTNAYTFDPITQEAPPPSTNGVDSTASPVSRPQNVLRIGDTLSVSFADLGANAIAPIDDQIKPDGTITLIYNQKFEAAGKTVGELQTDIRTRYVTNYFVNMTPTVKIQDRFYSVGGEVRANNRYLWTGSMTVLQAINTAGGFTDFANRSNVTLTRANGEQMPVNCKRAISHPELDLPVFPGDTIFVKKRLW